MIGFLHTDCATSISDIDMFSCHSGNNLLRPETWDYRTVGEIIAKTPQSANDIPRLAIDDAHPWSKGAQISY